MKAQVNPTYYFSRKVCLEASLSLLAPAISLPEQTNSSQPDDWTLLTWTASGLTRGNFIHAYIGLGLELNQQLEEDPPLPLTISTPPPQQVEILRILSSGRDWSTNRIKRGDSNIKGHVFVSCLCGQIEAMQKATSTEEGIVKEARKSVEHCLQLMKDKLRDQEAKARSEVDRTLSVDASLDGVDWEAVVSSSLSLRVQYQLTLYRCKIRVWASTFLVNGSSLVGKISIFGVEWLLGGGAWASSQQY